MVAPVTRFALAVPAIAEDAPPAVQSPPPSAPPGRTVTRVVSRNGRISLATFPYPVGVFLAGETVEVVLRDDGLVEIFHRGVLVKVHARRHSPQAKLTIPTRSAPRPRPAARPTSDLAVIRLVDSTGCVSFAGTGYRVGKAFRGCQVEVRLLKDTVEFWLEGERIRTHTATHDPSKLHGAFATPGGRPRKAKVG